MRYLLSKMALIQTISTRLFCLFLATLFLPTIALSVENPLIITNAWIQEAPPNAEVMAGYMTLANRGSRPVTLRSITSQSFRKIEIHRTMHQNGIAKMSSLEQITIPGQKSIIFEPGSYHLMMFSPEKPLLSGDTVVISLQLENHPAFNQSFLVRREMSGTQNKDHHHH